MFITIITTLLGVCLVSWLLYINKITGMHFTVLLIAIFGFAIYLGNFGQVKEVNLKEGKVIISEFKNISEDLVGVIAYNISTTGRFAPDDLEKRVVESR